MRIRGVRVTNDGGVRSPGSGTAVPAKNAASAAMRRCRREYWWRYAPPANLCARAHEALHAHRIVRAVPRVVHSRDMEKSHAAPLQLLPQSARNAARPLSFLYAGGPERIPA